LDEITFGIADRDTEGEPFEEAVARVQSLPEGAR